MGWIGVVRSPNTPGFELRMAVFIYEVAQILYTGYEPRITGWTRR
jgi:hypothetical protein